MNSLNALIAAKSDKQYLHLNHKRTYVKMSLIQGYCNCYLPAINHCDEAIISAKKSVAPDHRHALV